MDSRGPLAAELGALLQGLQAPHKGGRRCLGGFYTAKQGVIVAEASLPVPLDFACLAMKTGCRDHFLEEGAKSFGGAHLQCTQGGYLAPGHLLGAWPVGGEVGKVLWWPPLLLGLPFGWCPALGDCAKRRGALPMVGGGGLPCGCGHPAMRDMLGWFIGARVLPVVGADYVIRGV